ncbi:transposase, partial [Streptomyces sp. NPDC057403]|uniref:transposase n=1 Tax=Streptomyces sp. NPDC057403 TaxID=3346119 RepID=UPI0036BD27DA
RSKPAHRQVCTPTRCHEHHPLSQPQTPRATPREHSQARTTWRNAHRERLLTTQAGDLDLEIPKVRPGSVFGDREGLGGDGRRDDPHRLRADHR